MRIQHRRSKTKKKTKGGDPKKRAANVARKVVAQHMNPTHVARIGTPITASTASTPFTASTASTAMNAAPTIRSLFRPTFPQYTSYPGSEPYVPKEFEKVLQAKAEANAKAEENLKARGQAQMQANANEQRKTRKNANAKANANANATTATVVKEIPKKEKLLKNIKKEKLLKNTNNNATKTHLHEITPYASDLLLGDPETTIYHGDPTLPPVEDSPALQQRLEYANPIMRYTPYGPMLRARFRLNPRNLTRQPNLQGADRYQAFLDNGGLNQILAHSTLGQINGVVTVFTPQVLLEFKCAMMHVFRRNPAEAQAIFEIFLVQVVDHAGAIRHTDHTRSLVRDIIARMRGDNPLQEVQRRLADLDERMVNGPIASAISSQRRIGFFEGTMRTLARRLLIAGGGAIVLFLLMYNGIGSVDELRVAVDDAIHHPDGSAISLQEAIQTMRRYFGQEDNARPAPPAPPVHDSPAPAEIPREQHSAEVVQSWTTYYHNYAMWVCGYNPVKLSNQRKFAENTRIVTGRILSAIGTMALHSLYTYLGGGRPPPGSAAQP